MSMWVDEFPESELDSDDQSTYYKYEKRPRQNGVLSVMRIRVESRIFEMRQSYLQYRTLK